MDDQFTEPPWCSDVAGMIYAPNGRPGQTTVATLRDDAPAELLAAAPDLLLALKDALPCLEDGFENLSPGALRNTVCKARNCANAAIIRARVGDAENTSDQPLWEVNSELDVDERKANQRLLDAAADLRDAAEKAHAIAHRVSMRADVVGTLHDLLARTAP